jgi:transposase
MKTVALDVHAASFTLEVMTAGGQVAQRISRQTTGRNLIEVVDAVVGPKTLIVEESHLAQWVKRTLSPYVDELIVCDPQRNAWIAKDEYNDDDSSAHKLALLYRGGFLKPIVHPDDQGAQLRGLFLHYYDLNQQLTRFKNKLKGTFRQEAIVASGPGIYKEDEHETWLKQLKGQPHLQHAARQRFTLIDTLSELKQQTFEAMVKTARKNKAFALLQTVPGAGPVIATGYVALIDTPTRFSRKNKLWSYAALSNKQHTSDDETYCDHASSRGNRVLKWVVIEHFHHAVAIGGKDNRFRQQYQALRRKGLDHTPARRAICRALLSTVRAMWIKGEEYRDKALS